MNKKISQNNIKSNTPKKRSRKGLATGVMLTAGVLATNLNQGQTIQTDTTNNKNKNTPTQVEGDNILTTNKEISQTLSLDSLDYREYFDYPIEWVVDKFGEEKALEIIQYNLLLEINISRKEVGIEPLVLDKNLLKASQSYAQEMFKNKRYSHTGKNGSDASKRAKKAGYTGKFFVGENIGKDYYSIEQAIQERRNSKPHYKKIIDPQRNILGIGYYDGYRVLMFAR